MARVATAWVEIKPDMSGFKEELQARLARIHITKDITIRPDVKEFANLLEKAALGPRARKATKKAGEDGGKGFLGGFMRALGSPDLAASLSNVSNGWMKFLMNPMVLAAGSWGVLVIAGFLGAATAALAGVGAIGLGAFLLKDEPGVKAAASRLGSTFMTTFKNSAKGFEGGLIAGLGIFQQAIPGIAASFGRLLDGLAPAMLNLARGLAGMVQNVMAGVEGGLPAIKAVFSSISRFLPQIGSAIGGIFSKLAEDPQAVKETMDLLLIAIRNLTSALGSLMSTGVKVASNTAVWTRNFKDLHDAFLTFPSDINAAKKFWNDWSGHTDRARREADELERKIKEASDHVLTDIQKMFPLTSFETVQQALDITKEKFGGVVYDTDAFRKAVQANLQALGGAQALSDLENFRRQAASGFKEMRTGAEKVRAAIDSLVDGLDILNGRFLDQQAASDAFQSTMNNITKSLQDQAKEIQDNEDLTQAQKDAAIALTKAWEGNSEAAIANRASVAELGREMQASFKANIKAGDSLATVNQKYEEQKKSLKDVLAQFGVTGKAADDYIKTVLKTPREAITNAVIEGIPGAQALLDELDNPRSVPYTPYIPPPALTDIENKWNTFAAQQVNNANAQGAAGGTAFAYGFANGMTTEAAKEAIRQHASNMVGTARGFLQYSPAKEGPLSGKGDTKYAGMKFATQFAEGMTSGVPDVRKAATAVAGAARLTPSTGPYATIDGLGRVTVNVHIGNEQFNGYIRTQIDEGNESLGRAMIYGRSGV